MAEITLSKLEKRTLAIVVFVILVVGNSLVDVTGGGTPTKRILVGMVSAVICVIYTLVRRIYFRVARG